MTTTTSALPAPQRLAWPSLLWIGTIHLGALLAFVPAYFSWSGLALCLLLHWVTGGIGICLTYHRLLTHRSFAVRPGWLEYVLTAVGACTRKEARSAGWPTIANIMRIPMRKTIPTPRFAVFSGRTCIGG